MRILTGKYFLYLLPPPTLDPAQLLDARVSGVSVTRVSSALCWSLLKWWNRSLGVVRLNWPGHTGHTSWYGRGLVLSSSIMEYSLINFSNSAWTKNATLICVQDKKNFSYLIVTDLIQPDSINHLVEEQFRRSLALDPLTRLQHIPS